MASKSVHFTLAPIFATIEARSSIDRPHTMQVVRQAQTRHCGTCHASCGQCHISRPNYVGGGFLSGHHFVKPPVETVCAACHGGRIFAEFTGTNSDYAADVHYSKAEMTCRKCHSADEMHSDGSHAANRFQIEPRPSCRGCHEKAVDPAAGNRFHTQHAKDLACQVCHAQANKNCFTCHVGTDRKGLPYFKCRETRWQFKIGRNPKQTPERPQAYEVVRHAPVDPALFDAYTPDALSRFDRLPTWKRSAPHNIQKHTPRNRSCNACHGQAGLFLGAGDLVESERTANIAIVVPHNQLPQPVKEVDP